MMRELSQPERPIQGGAAGRAARRRLSAAYTAVEVLMAMAVLAVGVVGVISMQKVTVASNLHAKNLAIATHIAQGWLGVLEAEAALWPNDGSLASTTWLRQGGATWFRPTYSLGLSFGPGFDALGNPVPDLDPDTNQKFCVDLRLSPLTTNNFGGGMIRAEVRVIWLRLDTVLSGTVAAPAHACSVAAAAVDGDDEQRLFHFVFMSGAVRQVGI